MCLAVPGKIIEVKGEDLDRRGRVDFSGVVKEASLAALPEAGVGDFVLVHAGFAISRVDEDEAKKTLSYLEAMGELEDPA